MQSKILFLENNNERRTLYTEMANSLKFEYNFVNSISDATKHLKNKKVDVIVANSQFENGVSKSISNFSEDTPSILVTQGIGANVKETVDEGVSCDFVISDEKGHFIDDLISLIEISVNGVSPAF